MKFLIIKNLIQIDFTVAVGDKQGFPHSLVLSTLRVIMDEVLIDHDLFCRVYEHFENVQDCEAANLFWIVYPIGQDDRVYETNTKIVMKVKLSAVKEFKLFNIKIKKELREKGIELAKLMVSDDLLLVIYLPPDVEVTTDIVPQFIKDRCIYFRPYNSAPDASASLIWVGTSNEADSYCFPL